MFVFCSFFVNISLKMNKIWNVKAKDKGNTMQGPEYLIDMYAFNLVKDKILNFRISNFKTCKMPTDCKQS